MGPSWLGSFLGATGNMVDTQTRYNGGRNAKHT